MGKKKTSKLKKVLLGILLVFCTATVLLIGSVAALRWINPPQTMFTLLENWDELDQERYNLRTWWVSGEEIPGHLKWAVIAAEDQTFYEHRGFDMKSISEAWEQRREGIRSRGASTISQQVAKNIYLWPAHSFFRKGIEAVITVLIELLWPKERILEVYLNIAEFGPGLFGAGKAADNFYGLNAQNLQPVMSARMAAVLPSPKRMRVEPPSPFAAERSEWILRQMTQLSGVRYVQDVQPAEEVPDTTTDEPGLPDVELEIPDVELDTLLWPIEPETLQ